MTVPSDKQGPLTKVSAFFPTAFGLYCPLPWKTEPEKVFGVKAITSVAKEFGKVTVMGDEGVTVTNSVSPDDDAKLPVMLLPTWVNESKSGLPPLESMYMVIVKVAVPSNIYANSMHERSKDTGLFGSSSVLFNTASVF
jgi:hypothetical protein